MTDPIGIPSGWECLAAIAWGFIPWESKNRDGHISDLLEQQVSPGHPLSACIYNLSFLDYDWSVGP